LIRERPLRQDRPIPPEPRSRRAGNFLPPLL
jgi:hypothetical protein